MVIPSFRFSLVYGQNIESSHNELTWFYNIILEQTLYLHQTWNNIFEHRNFHISI